MLTHYESSTGTLTATLTDVDDAAVTGATVTVTITQNGTAVTGETWPASMVDEEDGTYTYIVASDLLPKSGTRYIAAISATKAGVDAYAELPIWVVTDTT